MRNEYAYEEAIKFYNLHGSIVGGHYYVLLITKSCHNTLHHMFGMMMLKCMIHTTTVIYHQNMCFGVAIVFRLIEANGFLSQ